MQKLFLCVLKHNFSINKNFFRKTFDLFYSKGNCPKNVGFLIRFDTFPDSLKKHLTYALPYWLRMKLDLFLKVFPRGPRIATIMWYRSAFSPRISSKGIKYTKSYSLPCHDILYSCRFPANLYVKRQLITKYGEPGSTATAGSNPIDSSTASASVIGTTTFKGHHTNQSHPMMSVGVIAEEIPSLLSSTAYNRRNGWA